MSEYAIVKSFLSCLSSSVVFSLNIDKDRAHLDLIIENVKRAIYNQGLSWSTQKLLHMVIEHLISFKAGDIDSTKLDFLIDEAKRAIWRAKDCGIRVFVSRPNVDVAVVMSYNLVLLSQYHTKEPEVKNLPSLDIPPTITKCDNLKRSTLMAEQTCEPESGVTARRLVLHHEQLGFKPSIEVNCKIKAKNSTKVCYSRKEILDCNSPLYTMPEFAVSVWLMGIVKPPFNMITPPTTPTSPCFPQLLSGPAGI